jgi:hypothetical protein
MDCVAELVVGRADPLVRNDGGDTTPALLPRVDPPAGGAER